MYGLIYYVHIGVDLLSPVVVMAPYISRTALPVKKPTIPSQYNVYEVTSRDILYRYRFHWEVSFVGGIDPRDVAKLTAQINRALKHNTQGTAYFPIVFFKVYLYLCSYSFLTIIILWTMIFANIKDMFFFTFSHFKMF